MEYAIIFETFTGQKWLKGFTNTPINLEGKSTKTYTIKLKDILHIDLELSECNFLIG